MTAPVAAVARAAGSARSLGPVGEQALFTAALVVAGAVGRASIVEGLTLGLIWPAAGVAVIGFGVAARRGRVHVLVTALLFAGVTFGFGAAIGTSWQASLSFLLANLVQVGATLLALRHLLGSTTPFDPRMASALSTVRGVLALTGAAAGGSLLGALVGVSSWALWVPSLAAHPGAVLLWWGRNAVGVIGMCALTSLLADALRQHRSGTGTALLSNRSVLDSLDAALARSSGRDEAARTEPALVRHRVAVTALFVLTGAAYTLDFTRSGPTVFPLIAFTIWSGLLFSGLVTVLHTSMCASLLVFWTMRGSGPFTLIESPQVMAAQVQLYLAFVLVLGLLLAAARAEIRAGLTRVVEAEDSAAARADLLGAVTEAMSDGLMVVDASSTIVTANRSAVELLGIDPGRVNRCTDLVMLRPDGTRLPYEEYPSTVARLTGEVGQHDLVVMHPDGTPRTLSVRATRLDEAAGRARRTPEEAPVAIVFTDVTDERAQHDYLAGFAGMVAHDLRSPLTTLRGWLDMCAMLATAEPGATAGDLIDPIERATLGAVQMGRLIDDLLMHVSAHGQVLELEPVDLARLALEVADAHGVGEALVVGDVPEVWVDRALVHQLVTNLVGNAAKYRHPDRPLALSLTGSERHGIVTLVLEDNGVGIPDADRDKVFERFYRVDAHRELGTGTGLGLSMCRTIVERHGGTIRALARPGLAGTAIEIILAGVPPLAAGPAHGTDDAGLGPLHRHLRSVGD